MVVKFINNPNPLTIQIKNLAVGMYIGRGSLTGHEILVIVVARGSDKVIDGVYRYTKPNAESKWYICGYGNEHSIIDPVLVDIEEIKLKIIK